MQLNTFLNKGREDRMVQILPKVTMLRPGPPVVCVDGFTVSIQCGQNNYCNPREDIKDVAEYESFELGYPSELDELLVPYAETEGTTETVFGWTPRSVVEALIKKHGGIKDEPK